MKNYLLVAPLLMFFLSNLSGAVRNGYEQRLPGLMLSLQGLRAILSGDDDLSRAERRRIEKNMKRVINEIAYYRITEKLLEQFRLIAPDLYRQVDTLRDAGGKRIDVYLKFIPPSHAPFGSPGTTSLTQASDDLNSCNSQYGASSVSVVISSLSGALRVMAHEFGHVVYVVQNMRSYVPFFRRTYKNDSGDIVFGHHIRDMSGKSAFKFEKRFRESYAQYARQASPAVQTFIAQVKPFRRDVLSKLAHE